MCTRVTCCVPGQMWMLQAKKKQTNRSRQKYLDTRPCSFLAAVSNRMTLIRRRHGCLAIITRPVIGWDILHTEGTFDAGKIYCDEENCDKHPDTYTYTHTVHTSKNTAALVGCLQFSVSVRPGPKKEQSDSMMPRVVRVKK